MELCENPEPPVQPEGDELVWNNGKMKVVINLHTGLIDSYEADGRVGLGKGSFAPLAIKDDENSWAHKEKSFRNIKGEFTFNNFKNARKPIFKMVYFFGENDSGISTTKQDFIKQQ